MKKSTQQINLLDEIIVDNFAGGGGASTGIELATGRPVTIAVNHDPDAILMHKTNHPYTDHYCESVWDVDPVKVCAGRKVGLAWFSPDCKHFSKAKGGKPVEKKIRGLAWVVLRWAALVKPRVIILENVEEFQTWGPVRRGRPIKSKSGMTFQRWKSQLEELGYKVEMNELRACDFGAPTIRNRFFVIARRDGKPIVWPEPTHGDPNSEAVKSGKLKPWRSAAEIIDWSLPCPSIFETREEIKQKYGVSAVRPLADNTMKRVARGLDKFVIKSAKPFIVPIGYGERRGQEPRVHNIDAPVSTVVSSAKQYLVSPSVVQVNHAGEFRGQDAREPLQTVTGKHGYGVSSPMLVPFQTAIGQTGFKSDRCRGVDQPINTTVSKAETCLVAPSLIQYHTEQSEKVRGQDVQQPIMTLDGSNRYGLASALLTEYYGNAQDGIDITGPMHTTTSKDREGLTLAYMSKYYAGGYKGAGNSPCEPLNTITAADHNALAAAFVSKFYGTSTGQPAQEPLHTITQSAGHFGEIRAYLAKWNGAQPLHNWPQIRDMLNRYCDYHIADDEILILEIGGVAYFIADIGLRMLIPRELYAANGFPLDYIIDRDYKGNAYGKSKQVARCGNAVPPPFATALVRVNLPELCSRKAITTMKALEAQIAI